MSTSKESAQLKARIEMALAEAGHPSSVWVGKRCPVGVGGCRCDNVGVTTDAPEELIRRAIAIAGHRVPCADCWTGDSDQDHHDCFHGRCPAQAGAA